MTTEARLLSEVQQKLASETTRYSPSDSLELRWQSLEAIAARLGGFDVEWFHSLQRAPRKFLPQAVAIAEIITEMLRPIPIHASIALASLAQPVLDRSEQRQTGSFYTDFRLADFLASSIPALKNKRRAILDPACGSGVLLAATVLRLAGHDRVRIAQLVGDVVCGCDTSKYALRASALVLASLTSDRNAIKHMLARLVEGDSLLMTPAQWSQLAPQGIRAVIMNPPWERLKASRHEFLSASGVSRHYGQEYERQPETLAYGQHRDSVRDYSISLAARFEELKGHEVDFYEAFLGLARHLLSGNGMLAALVPSGLIRSQGTTASRKALFDAARKLRISVLDNRARYFSIDTRFKFLMIEAQFLPGGKQEPIKLNYPLGHRTTIERGHDLSIGRGVMSRARPDYSMPEVRTQDEWNLFRRIALTYPQFGSIESWRHNYCREIDMTKDRSRFLSHPSKHSLPLIEGRMVHQFSSTAKAYVSGSGRRALWLPTIMGGTRPRPQFWFPTDAIRDVVADRIARPRLGFCDITGQTNERTMLAAIVPANVVCGNKVPTIEFAADGPNLECAYCFAGVANSIAFDWLLRRVMTTTVNYFILDSVPIPLPSHMTPLAQRIAQLSRQISLGQSESHSWSIGEQRAELDCRIFKAYDCTSDDVRIMLADFPLLDRGEPPIDGEEKSTITSDLISLRWHELHGGLKKPRQLESRVAEARKIGAVPFRSSHMADRSERNVLDRAEK